MNDYWLIIVRTIVLYVIVIIVFRLMGKREVGELSLVDFAIYVLIAEVGSLAVEDLDQPFMLSVVPIFVLLIIQYINSVFILKHKQVRDVIDGDPTVIIRDGLIMESEMRKQRYNLDDLFQQLREQGISSIQSISYAFLEQSGKLSIFEKDKAPFLLPLIMDGYVDQKHLSLIGKTEKWLEDELRRQGVYSPSEVFYAYCVDQQLYIQLKARK